MNPVLCDLMGFETDSGETLCVLDYKPAKSLPILCYFPFLLPSIIHLSASAIRFCGETIFHPDVYIFLLTFPI